MAVKLVHYRCHIGRPANRQSFKPRGRHAHPRRGKSRGVDCRSPKLIMGHGVMGGSRERVSETEREGERKRVREKERERERE
jgi:hypothetical protein